MDHLEALRDFQHLFEGGDLLTCVLGAFPAAEIQLPQLVEGHVRNVAVDAGLEVGEVVMGHHEVTVLGELDVALEAVCAQRLGQTEGRQRVFGGQMGRAAMGDNERAHGQSSLEDRLLKKYYRT